MGCSGNAKRSYYFDARAGKCVKTIPYGGLCVHSGYVRSVLQPSFFGSLAKFPISSNGKMIMTDPYNEKEGALIVDVNTGRLLHRIPPRHPNGLIKMAAMYSNVVVCQCCCRGCCGGRHSYTFYDLGKFGLVVRSFF